MALGDKYRGRIHRAKFRGWLTLTTAHRGVNRGLIHYLANHGVLEDDHPDLGSAGPPGELAWDAVGGGRTVLEELGDIARTDGSTQYFSYVPATGFPAELLPLPGEPLTMLWFGRYGKSSATKGLIGWGNTAITNYANIYQSVGNLRTIERAAGNGVQRVNIYTKLNPNEDELVVLIFRSDAERASLAAEGIIEYGSNQAALVAGATRDAAALLVNAAMFGTPSFLGAHRTLAIGVWNRYISDEEIAKLTEDPFLPMRPAGAYLGDQAAHLELVRNPLPCPGYPVARELRRPHEQTDGEGGSIVLAAPAPRIANELVSVLYDNLNEAEQVALEFAYDEGRGLANPFRFTIPGDTGASIVIFEEPFRFSHGSATAAAARIRLRIVNPPDHHRAPYVAYSQDAMTASRFVNLLDFQLSDDLPTILAADSAIVGFGMTQGTTAEVDEFRYEAPSGDVDFPIEVEQPVPPVGGLVHIAAGVLFAPEPSLVDRVSLRTKPAGGWTQTQFAALLVRGIDPSKAINAVASVLSASTTAPTITITTTVDGCIVLIGAHAEMDVQSGVLSFPAPLREHTNQEHNTVTTDELGSGSIIAARAGVHTYALAITGAGSPISTRIVAVALEPQSL